MLLYTVLSLSIHLLGQKPTFLKNKNYQLDDIKLKRVLGNIHRLIHVSLPIRSNAEVLQNSAMG